MIRFKHTILLAAVLLSAASCREREAPLRDTIPYVKQLAVDTTGAFSLVKAYRSAGARGSIAAVLAARLLVADEVDNIDAKPVPDRLPDFAGESFDIFLDEYNAPYLRLAKSSPDSLREVAVRSAVIAVDTVLKKEVRIPL